MSPRAGDTLYQTERFFQFCCWLVAPPNIERDKRTHKQPITLIPKHSASENRHTQPSVSQNKLKWKITAYLLLRSIVNFPLHLTPYPEKLLLLCCVNEFKQQKQQVMGKSKEPIRLRKRRLKDGSFSLYLDIYNDGQRTYEYLKLYLMPGTSKEVRAKNKETMLLAEAVRAKRLVEFQNGRFQFNKPASAKIRFFDYYKAVAEQRQRLNPKRSNWGDWQSNLKHMEKYEPNKGILLRDIDVKWIEGYKEYLLTKATAFGSRYATSYGDRHLSPNSAQTYFRKLRACLNKAFADGLIPENPMRKVESIKGREGTRMYLTLDEVRQLAATPCRYPDIKRSFLFSCLTGLRKSDIEKMTWGEIHQQGEFTRIIFTQKKTGGLEYLDISPEANKLLGERGRDDELVFPYMHSISLIEDTIKSWTAAAGIKKHITFHCGRHTFATMMLDLGADLFTVSKLLGHRDIKTTQIYAKILDKNKQEAVSKIPSIEVPIL